jgi:murein DD-endopeptidase MepM/ murein hydrolase activator NlpD
MPPTLPRLTRSRVLSITFTVAAVVMAACVGVTVALMLPAAGVPQVASAPPPPSPSDLLRIQHAAFRASVPVAQAVEGEIRPGDTFMGALQRLGVSRDEAVAAVASLSAGMDIQRLRAGMRFTADLGSAPGPQPVKRLVGLSLRPAPAQALSLERDAGGAFHLRNFEEKVTQETAVAGGPISGSLYLAAVRAGADGRIVADAARLFSHKIDFSRDLHPEDHFKLVFDRKVTESGRTIETGNLLFAELESKGKSNRFYRFRRDGRDEYFDETGKNIKGFLLRTPVDAARVTSGFGMRFHPVLGYTRMHQGIDFGASTGTPVYAAGDGVVDEIKWANGYGHWLKLRHAAGWATGYGHLSAYVRGLRVGQRVRQGQVIAYVGMTGIATGPHLHYEVMNRTQKMDPKGAKVPQGSVLGGRELAAFRSEKAHIDQLIAQAGRRTDGAVQTARAGAGRGAGGL